jgi:DNA-binding MarR family transcriptional regulator
MAQTPGLGTLDDLIGLQLRLAQLRFFDDYYQQLGHVGLSPAEHAVLALLLENPGVRQGALGEALRIKRSNMTKVMRGLEERGLVWRAAPKNDGRAFEVRPTERGRAMASKLSDPIHATDARSAAALNEAERQQLLALLRKLNGGTLEQVAAVTGEREALHG